MVFSGFGLDLTEERLRELCDCSPLFGTEAMRAVDAARGLGFAGTAKHTLWYEELRGLVEGGRYPIAYLSLEAIGGKGGVSRGRSHRSGRRGGHGL
jgi:hypothetical protein